VGRKKQKEIIVYYVMRSKNEVLCAAAGRLAAERSDLACLLYSRSSAEIITSRTPSAEIITSRTPSAEIITSGTLLSGDNNFTDAGQLVRCHDNEVTL
jgi:hypothetical protein